MLTSATSKRPFIDTLLDKYSAEIDPELRSKCLELSNIYDDFCIFGISKGSDAAVYFIPFTSLALSSLRDEVSAFFGLNYSEGTSFEIQEPKDHQIDCDIFLYTGLPFFKFRPLNNVTFDKLNDKLDLYLRIKLRRTKSLFRHEYLLDKLLLNFNNALAQEDIAAAEMYLHQIEVRPDISVMNKIFLTIKFFYLTKNWTGIVQHKHLLDLRKVRKPFLISEYILIAIFNSQIKPLVSTPEEALRVYNEKVAPLFSNMMLFSEGYKSKEVYLLLALALIGKNHPENHEIEFIKTKINELSDSGIPVSAYLNLLSSIKPPHRTHQDLLSELQSLYDEERVFDMINLLEMNKKAIGIDHLRILLSLSFDSLDLSYIRRVNELYLSLDKQLQDDVFSRAQMRKSINIINDLLNKQLTIDTWLSMVLNNHDESEIASTFRNIKESIDSQIFSEKTVFLLEEIFTKQNNQWVDEIKLVIPHLIRGIGEIDANIMSIKWKFNLLDFLSGGQRFNERDRRLIMIILDSVLSEGLTTQEYEQVLFNLRVIWSEIKSPRTVLWPLEVLGELYFNGIKDQGVTDDFVNDYLEFLQSNKNSIDGSDIIQIDKFFKDNGIETAGFSELRTDQRIIEKENASREMIISILKEVTIGIYSLTESAARQARNYFIDLYKKSDIRLNHDKVCTRELKLMLRASDILVFSDKSSSHAAFDCGVQKYNPIYPSGRGVSSIINVIMESLKKYSGAA